MPQYSPPPPPNSRSRIITTISKSIIVLLGHPSFQRLKSVVNIAPRVITVGTLSNTLGRAEMRLVWSAAPTNPSLEAMMFP
jgi:hypothetical protein